MSNRITYGYPTRAEIDELATRLKQSDIDELDAAYGVSAAEAMSILDPTSTNGAYVDGRLEMVFGINDADYSDGMAAVWMLSSDAVYRHAKTLVKSGRAWLDAQQRNHAVLFNFVDARSTRTLSWLKRMGFEMRPVAEMGAHKLPFYLIMRR